MNTCEDFEMISSIVFALGADHWEAVANEGKREGLNDIISNALLT